MNKARILVVDDSKLDLTIIHGVLSSAYDVSLAESGEEALGFLADNHPNLIILDVQMKGMSGPSLLRLMKDDPRWRDIPVIFLTGSHSQKSEAEAFRLGAADYLRKPINIEVLLARVKMHIEWDEIMNHQLRLSRQSLQVILDSLPVPIRIVDPEDGKIIYVNNSFLELLEYPADADLCGVSIDSLLPDYTASGTEVSEIIEMITRAEDPVSFETEYMTAFGGTIDAVEVTRLLDYEGKRSSIGIIKDLTAEREREHILLRAMEREKDANQAKSLFLANMSHEIRTPMNGIIGMTDLLLNENLTERQMQYANDIKMSAESLLGIINDILDISKINEGKLKILPVDVDINVVLKNLISIMGFTARTKRLEFIDDIRLNAPEYVRVDDMRLRQIIVNLLSNAVKFTKTGHIKLMAEIRDGYIVVEVSDTGIGIKKDELPIIFKAFEQADMKKNRMINGTGLGLSITKNLVELMDGEITVESEYGAGTTFTVKVPYVPGDESAVKPVDVDIARLYAPTAQVLLVDDIQTNLTLGTGILRLYGISADVALSGNEAIELVTKKNYDIIFMDHMMPGMDGIETLHAIRQMGGKYERLPVVALTANAVSESKTLLLNSGMDDFISKPIDKHALMSVLVKWLPPEKVSTDQKPAGSAPEKAYSEVLEKASKLEELDVKLALSRINGLQDVLEKTIRQTSMMISGRLRKMDTQLADDDLSGFAIEVHGLKGALASIGATSLSELASELEISAKADNKTLCLKKFPVFNDMLEVFEIKLRSVFKQSAPELKPRGGIDLLCQKIDETIALLEKFEAAGAAELLNVLEAYSFEGDTDVLLSEAKRLVSMFKYDEAIYYLTEARRSR